MKSQVSEPTAPFRTAFGAFGTELCLSIWPRLGREGAARDALSRTTGSLRQAEQRLSRFLPESELSRINRSLEAPVRVSQLTVDVVAAALDAAEATGGLFDPTVHDALVVAGYDRTFTELDGVSGAIAAQFPGGSSPHPARSCDYREVEIDRTNHRVTLPATVSLDLGGIAKGWLADRAATRLGRFGAALADLGGDVALCGRPPGGGAWRIDVAAPAGQPALLGRLIVRSGGVATSGITQRRWRTRSGWRHHLIDPRTGQPALTDLLSATVVAPSATAAEIAAKAVMLLGSDAGARAIASSPELGGVFVRKDQTIFTAGAVTWLPVETPGPTWRSAS
jgi:thiamine biosynthesis lipoprotein